MANMIKKNINNFKKFDFLVSTTDQIFPINILHFFKDKIFKNN